ncbi:hypothetical protein EB118_07485 [bacterium]|nr:hypothetical protein [bacterium]NBX98245.1 hypothetical protein [bacterium]NDC94653.1 hypothetical protein [bacterium]NDD84275.1 hypothetical protein [bacterium]NDG29923.1 hypothetical protein [bacterium]
MLSSTFKTKFVKFLAAYLGHRRLRWLFIYKRDYVRPGQCVLVPNIGASTHCRETRAKQQPTQLSAIGGKMFGKSSKSDRHGARRAKARTKKKVRSPEGRKVSADRHVKKVTERGKIEAKRAKTAERLGRHDLIDVRLNGLDIA